MRRDLKAVLWIGIYLALVLAPLILLFVSPRLPQRGFLREFAVAMGFVGLSLMGLQFIPTARLGFITNVFPVDTLYYFHHWTSVLATIFVAAHPILLAADNPNILILFDLANAPWRARAGITAGAAVLLLTVLSVWRKELKLEYEPWRVLHNVLAIGAVGLTLWHIFGVRYYLATPAQRVLWIALPVVWAAIIGYVRVYKPWQMRQHPWRVKEVREERGECFTLCIEPVGHDGFTFEPGQFAWITVDRTPFQIREHPFSFTSSAELPEAVCFTIKELGDFTSQIDELEPGTEVYVDGPYGIFSIDEHEAPAYVLIAGGIGVAPMMSILRTMADRGDQRSVIMFYGSVSWDAVTFREELEELEEQLNLEVVHVLEEPPEDWEGETGYVTAEVMDRHLPENREELLYFTCGPLVMLSLVKKALVNLGVPLQHIEEERYEMA
jgi:predicted ferric reductase